MDLFFEESLSCRCYRGRHIPRLLSYQCIYHIPKHCSCFHAVERLDQQELSLSPGRFTELLRDSTEQKVSSSSVKTNSCMMPCIMSVASVYGSQPALACTGHCLSKDLC